MLARNVKNNNSADSKEMCKNFAAKTVGYIFMYFYFRNIIEENFGEGSVKGEYPLRLRTQLWHFMIYVTSLKNLCFF